MSETWRDIVKDVLYAKLVKNYGTDSDAANEEAKELCDVIFDALEVNSYLQDTPWSLLAKNIRNVENINSKAQFVSFDYKAGILVRTRYGDQGRIITLGYNEAGQKIYEVEIGLNMSAWLHDFEFNIIPPYGAT